MERYIDVFKREHPLKNSESAADYADRFMKWMVSEKGARYPGGADDDLQQKLLTKQLDALGACTRAGEHATSNNAFIQQTAIGALNGMLANPNEEMSNISSDRLTEISVDLAEKLYEKLHEKHHI